MKEKREKPLIIDSGIKGPIKEKISLDIESILTQGSKYSIEMYHIHMKKLSAGINQIAEQVIHHAQIGACLYPTLKENDAYIGWIRSRLYHEIYQKMFIGTKSMRGMIQSLMTHVIYEMPGDWRFNTELLTKTRNAGTYKNIEEFLIESANGFLVEGGFKHPYITNWILHPRKRDTSKIYNEIEQRYGSLIDTKHPNKLLHLKRIYFYELAKCRKEIMYRYASGHALPRVGSEYLQICDTIEKGQILKGHILQFKNLNKALPEIYQEWATTKNNNSSDENQSITPYGDNFYLPKYFFQIERILQAISGFDQHLSKYGIDTQKNLGDIISDPETGHLVHEYLAALRNGAYFQFIMRSIDGIDEVDGETKQTLEKIFLLANIGKQEMNDGMDTVPDMFSSGKGKDISAIGTDRGGDIETGDIYVNLHASSILRILKCATTLSELQHTLIGISDKTVAFISQNIPEDLLGRIHNIISKYGNINFDLETKDQKELFYKLLASGIEKCWSTGLTHIKHADSIYQEYVKGLEAQKGNIKVKGYSEENIMLVSEFLSGNKPLTEIDTSKMKIVEGYITHIIMHGLLRRYTFLVDTMEMKNDSNYILDIKTQTGKFLSKIGKFIIQAGFIGTTTSPKITEMETLEQLQNRPGFRDLFLDFKKLHAKLGVFPASKSKIRRKKPTKKGARNTIKTNTISVLSLFCIDESTLQNILNDNVLAKNISEGKWENAPYELTQLAFKYIGKNIGIEGLFLLFLSHCITEISSMSKWMQDEKLFHKITFQLSSLLVTQNSPYYRFSNILKDFLLEKYSSSRSYFAPEIQKIYQGQKEINVEEIFLPKKMTFHKGVQDLRIARSSVQQGKWIQKIKEIGLRYTEILPNVSNNIRIDLLYEQYYMNIESTETHNIGYPPLQTLWKHIDQISNTGHTSFALHKIIYDFFCEESEKLGSGIIYHHQGIRLSLVNILIEYGDSLETTSSNDWKRLFKYSKKGGKQITNDFLDVFNSLKDLSKNYDRSKEHSENMIRQLNATKEVILSASDNEMIIGELTLNEALENAKDIKNEILETYTKQEYATTEQVAQAILLLYMIEIELTYGKGYASTKSQPRHYQPATSPSSISLDTLYDRLGISHPPYH